MWILSVSFHWPHEKFMIGFQHIKSDEQFMYSTIELSLLVMTFHFDYQ